MSEARGDRSQIPAARSAAGGSGGGAPRSGGSLFAKLLEQRILGHLGYAMVFLAGAFALRHMPVEEYPNVSFHRVSIITIWPGASAEDVERLVTKKIEDEVEDVKGITYIQSTSIPGSSRVHVKFDDDMDDREFDLAVRDLESEIRKVKDLPPLAEEPEIERIEIENLNPVVIVVAYGDADEAVRKGVVDELERRLEALPGVRRCNIFGVRDREVHVDVDPERLAGYGLTLEDVARALAARNVGAPGGVLRGGGAEIVVRTGNEWEAIAELLETPIRTPTEGGTLRLREVARVRPGYEEATILAKYQGRDASTLSVVKTTEANALEIREAVGKAVRRFEDEGLVPPGLELGFVADTTVRIRDRVSVLASDVLLGSALIFVILGLFLGFRMSLLATVGIAFAFLGTFVGLKALGESLNVLTLFGLVLVSGLLVDDAIVIIENVVRRRERGEDLMTATRNGVAEVAGPVTAGVATMLAAFLPLFLMSGVTGKFFAVIPTAVCIALVVSLVEGLTLLPIHIAEIGTGRAGSGEGAPRDSLAMRVYKRLLGVTVRHRYLTVVAVVALSALAIFSLRYVKVVFFPSDYQLLFINTKLPPDASLEDTEAVLDHVDAAIRGLGEDVVESTFGTPGFYYDYNYQPHVNAHYGQILVTLAQPDRRKITTKEAMAAIRGRLEREDLGRATIEVTELNDGPPIGRPIVVRVQSDDLADLRRLAIDVRREVADTRGVKDVQLDLEFGKLTAVARVDEERAAANGVAPAAVAQALADANDGRIATRFKAKDDEWDVRVRVSPEARRTVADLGAVRVRNASGALVPVGDVARLDVESGFAAIGRYERRRTVTVTADVDPAATDSLAANAAIERRLEPLLAREPALRVSYAGEFEETNKSFESLFQAFVIAMLAIYTILGAQFRSYLDPFVVLASVPFALLGVVLGFHATGDPFTVAIGLGSVGLAGIAVNDAILMLEFANDRRRDGATAEEAILDAGPRRLRPIFLNSATTIVGLLPAAIGFGGRSIVWGPMASALCFGLGVQTVLTLLLTPAFYLVAEDLRRLARRAFGRRGDPAAAAPAEAPTAAPAGAERTPLKVP